ncbi:hypothetical protein DRE_00231 [Drechslerella stenobrocha 248]|uniref:PA14 domain-containing protein n=1 Tax=Drechslerella stenobrocha 248 TaxID=1043628 RepID=W7HXJ4_9PEZI|nr:hypothetical protein DRE_00231 [Drechslerella stenobrocha 248]
MKISTIVSCLLAAPVAYGAVIKRGPCHENNLFRALKRVQRDSDPAFCSNFLFDDNTPYPPNERNVPVTTPKADVTNACRCLLGDSLGFEVAIYENPYEGQGSGAEYLEFEHWYVATKEPWGTSVAKFLGSGQANEPGEDEPWRYGLPTLDGLYYTLNLRGYFLCPADGTFTITFHQADDVAYVWVGEEAKCGWTNPVLTPGTTMRSYWTLFENTLDFTCTKGAFTPLRIIWADIAGPRSLFMDIKDASGNLYVQNTVDSPFLFRHSATNSVGPFPGTFGNEPTVCA